MRSATLITILALLYLLHNDFWLWWRSDLLGGVPIGLAYHIAYCVVVAIFWSFVVQRLRSAVTTPS